MTTPPKYFQLADKVPGLFTSKTSPARALGRAHVFFLDLYHVIPTVETLPWATDFNGQGYPAGTVGVRVAYPPGQDDGAEVQGGASIYSLVLVPSALPDGYTPRLVREHFYRPGGGAGFGQAWFQAGFSPLPPYYASATSHQIRLADGLHDYWLTIPEAHGRDGYTGTVASSGWNNTASAGLRYLQWQGVQPGITVELRCNANGSSAGTGDTSLALYTNSGGSNADSPFFTAGLQFPLGEKRRLYFKVSPSPPDVITLIAGPRVDLPLPFLTSGPSIVVPGGYLPGKLDVHLPT